MLLLLIASACTLTEEPPIIVPPSPPPGNGTDVTLRLTFQDEKGLDTRAITAVEENKVDSLHLYIFKSSDAPNHNNRMKDTFLYAVKATDIQTLVSGTDGNEKQAKVTFKSSPYGQRFIIIANKPASLTPSALGLVEGTTTFEQFWPKFKFAALQWRNVTANVTTPFNTPNLFPMFGQSTKFRSVGSAPIAGLEAYPSEIKVNMVRAVAKVNVRVDINNNTGDPALGGNTYFRIDSIYVYNAADSGYIAPKFPEYDNDSLLTKISKPNPTVITSIARYKFPATVHHQVPALENTIYLAERDSANFPAFLILAADYYGERCYYRVDFVRKDADHIVHLLRNHSYTFNITGLRKKGFENEEQAMLSDLPLVNPYLILDNADSDITDIVYNRDNFLGVETTVLKADFRGTIGTTSMKLKVMQQDTKVEATSAMGTVNVVDMGNGDRKLWYTVPPFDYGGTMSTENREFTITLTTNDNLKQTIRIIQQQPPYSYIGTDLSPIMVYPHAALSYNRSNLATVPNWWTQVEAVQVYPTVNIIQSGFTDDYSTFAFNAYNVPGQYIVVLRNIVDHTIYWSWLFTMLPSGTPGVAAGGWEYKGPVHHYNGYEFMTFDLGGTPTNPDGAYFQWGRKDAFFSSAYTTRQAAPNNSIDSANANPQTFFYNPIAPFDWKRDWQNNNMWVDVDGEKGPYDPCPFGWRVPQAESDALSPWNDFHNTNSNNGMQYAASGRIDGLTGSYTASPTGKWSASARTNQAYALELPNILTSAHRAHGYTIRCVRDNIRSIK
jgi:hypothetical protein